MVFEKALLVTSLLLAAASTVSAADHEPDTISTCNSWIMATDIDDCQSLADLVGVTVEVFNTWNPSLKKNCQGVKPNWEYCASVSGPVNPPPPTSTLVTSVKPPPPVTKPPPTTTPKPPTPPPAQPKPPTLKPSNFPPTKGSIQCVPAPKTNQLAVAIQNYSNLQKAIQTACNELVGPKSNFLEKGDAYGTDVDVTNHNTRFQLQILKGGFPVPVDMCVKQLQSIAAKNECKATLNNKAYIYGGCSFTSDYNLQACIFPWINPK